MKCTIKLTTLHDVKLALVCEFKKNVFFAHIILQNKKMLILQLSHDQPKNVDWLASINH